MAQGETEMEAERHEPTIWQVNASYKSPANTKLARAIWQHLTFVTYDRYGAHRIALKLISAQPQNGEEVAACMVGFDRMVDGAIAHYRRNPTKRAHCDAIASIFAEWAATELRLAA